MMQKMHCISKTNENYYTMHLKLLDADKCTNLYVPMNHKDKSEYILYYKTAMCLCHLVMNSVNIN